MVAQVRLPGAWLHVLTFFPADQVGQKLEETRSPVSLRD